MKEIIILKSLYWKQAILYTINLYLEEAEYTIKEDDSNYILQLENLNEEDFKLLKSELTFNSLRFQIADNNKEMRKAIISKALWSINVE